MKKLVLIIILIAGGGFIYKLTTVSSPEEEEKSRRGSRWSNAHINPSGGIHHGDHDDDDKNEKDSKKQALKSKKGKDKTSSKNSESPKNPFLKTGDDLQNVTWEEAKDFAFRDINFKPKNEEEASLLEANRMMAATFMVANSHEKLIEYYNSKGLKADVGRDSNPYTGTMITVRTEKSLPGTRYPHTQYFTNENNVAFQQHFSIEYRPGPKAFARTKEMAEELYGVNNGKYSKDRKVITYKLGNGQILWIQEMQSKDLKGDPFNAYEPTDVGTIRIAIEEEIHPEGDDHDHSGDRSGD